MNGARSRRIWPWATILVLIATWVVASRAGYTNPLAVPDPISFLRAARAYGSTQESYAHIGLTLFRAMGGLLISIVIGVPLGLLAGRVEILHQVLRFPVDFFRSIPSSALFFLFILAFGIGETAKLMVVVYGCALILFVSATYGSRPTPDRAFRLAIMRTLGASRTQCFWWVTLPDALPQIASGVRTCISLAFVLVIVTEMFLGAQLGIGKQLYDYYLAFRIPEMWVCLIVLGIMGYAANLVGVGLERRAGRWRSDRTTLI